MTDRKFGRDSGGISRRDWIRNAGVMSLGMALGGRVLGQGLTETLTRETRYPELKYINLAGNENPFGPSQKVSMAIMREVGNSCRYPFREEEILKDRIAEREGVSPENILLGNGCDEILSLAAAAYATPGTTVVSARPTYLQLGEYAEKKGAHVEWVDHTKTMQHDLDAMLSAVEERDAVLSYVCNPDTPSGTIRTPDEIKSYCLNACETGAVFLDEVYLELLPDFQSQTQVELVKQGYPVIIGRSFSKMHGLAGHRIGYGITTPEIVKKLGNYKMSSPSYLGVIAAIASLDDETFHLKAKALIADGRNRYCELLDGLGLRYTPSVGNFVFHYTGIEIRSFQKMMKDRGFLVGRPFPPYHDWCRISIGTQQEMASYKAAMLEVFEA
ncbi:histidinol-phosphate transaminase [Pelagicoccus sp. SDUM812002]|uniref:pyridoxal phosphate-dependent aminotransferase n=1 Tax=Pelagicoccus sp. SDUM812002 TaxID=3041266 RepID=UPI00280E84D6|nr:histidinol-phosphate transaminase [Pelagicoccus sp. SDUM812002]MDQ8185887.1 histidinol-phosphate transaminase [Pelagicoccus sp. SDUM812002]